MTYWSAGNTSQWVIRSEGWISIVIANELCLQYPDARPGPPLYSNCNKASITYHLKQFAFKFEN